MVINKRRKTPLRWCGGKSRAIYKISKFNPNMKEIIEFRDAFLGGGSYPIYLSQMYPHLKIWVNDIYKPLYVFWIMLRDNSIELIRRILEEKREMSTPELAKERYLKAKKNIDDEDPLIMAVNFYIVNKHCFSGMTENSGYSKGTALRFTENMINSLKYYVPIIQNWKITNLDYKELLKDGNENVLIYLDPPYNIKSCIYGKNGKLHKHFNHGEFKKICQNLPHIKILISYNEEIDLLTNNSFELNYSMNSTKKYLEAQKKRKEMIIRNY